MEESEDEPETGDDVNPVLQENLSLQEDVLSEEIPDRLVTRDSTPPTPAEAYEAFGSLLTRMYASGEFAFEDIKVGDILRVK